MLSTEKEKNHPVFLKQYSICTPAILETSKVISRWIDDRVTGGYIHGPSRYGKTTAIKQWLVQLIEEKHGNTIYAGRCIFLGRSNASDKDFLVNLARTLGHLLVSSRTIGQLEDRLANFLIVRAKERGADHVEGWQGNDKKTTKCRVRH